MSANTKLTPAIPRLNRSAVLLALATLITLGVGEQGLGGRAIMALLLGLALFKGRLIVLDFMGLRRTAPLWRRLVLGWLVLQALVIALAYRISSS
ncbi:MAG: cytochrome C oxidase subunit IV family protein [Rhodocyclales bacterium]|nr:cytochrome C oxidase subunit IV family protein [Rhodocyclales bacterium]